VRSLLGLDLHNASWFWVLYLRGGLYSKLKGWRHQFISYRKLRVQWNLPLQYSKWSYKGWGLLTKNLSFLVAKLQRIWVLHNSPQAHLKAIGYRLNSNSRQIPITSISLNQIEESSIQELFHLGHILKILVVDFKGHSHFILPPKAMISKCYLPNAIFSKSRP
jgi:hypothetical protein